MLFQQFQLDQKIVAMAVLPVVALLVVTNHAQPYEILHMAEQNFIIRISICKRILVEL